MRRRPPKDGKLTRLKGDLTTPEKVANPPIFNKSKLDFIMAVKPLIPQGVSVPTRKAKSEILLICFSDSPHKDQNTRYIRPKTGRRYFILV